MREFEKEPEAARYTGGRQKERLTVNGNTATKELLERLRTELPQIWQDAQVVGTWVWLEFSVPPDQGIRAKLKELGFHWNGARKCWQHPCHGVQCQQSYDPRQTYPVLPATSLVLNEMHSAGPRNIAKEYKVIALRECALPDELHPCDTPEKAVEYWRSNVATCPYYNPECECFVVLLLNTRRRVKGHQLVSIGTLDTLLVHPREVFRVAIITAASAIVIMHNHPSNDSTPSEADIKVTRDLIRAGQLLKIDVLDHVIVGNPNSSSLRALGYFL